MSEGAGIRVTKGGRGQRKGLHEYSQENDIQYRGPLSYGGMQILGWLCIVLSMVGAMLNIGGKVSEDLSARFTIWSNAMGVIGSMSLPFLLLVNFARILNNEEGYRKQILRNFCAMAGIFLGVLVFYRHFIVCAVSVFALIPRMPSRC